MKIGVKKNGREINISNKSIFLGFMFHLVCTDTHEITLEMVIGLMQSHSFLSRNLIFFFRLLFRQFV